MAFATRVRNVGSNSNDIIVPTVGPHGVTRANALLDLGTLGTFEQSMAATLQLPSMHTQPTDSCSPREKIPPAVLQQSPVPSPRTKWHVPTSGRVLPVGCLQPEAISPNGVHKPNIPYKPFGRIASCVATTHTKTTTCAFSWPQSERQAYCSELHLTAITYKWQAPPDWPTHQSRDTPSQNRAIASHEATHENL